MTHAGGERGPEGNVIIAGPLRLAMGLGDTAREQELQQALDEAGDFIVTARCLAAEHLLACIQGGQVDVALVAYDLHRLSASRLSELARSPIPLVLLAPATGQGLWQRFPRIVPLGADPQTVAQALHAAARGEPPQPAPAAETAIVEPLGRAIAPPGALCLLTVASGRGSPGRTTVALNLAAALGAVAPTVLVDADLCGPSITTYLDANPTRNLYMLAHARPETPLEWDQAIGQETQPLGPTSPHGAVLCGVPKPEMRSLVSAIFFQRLIGELRQRYRYVIVDVGADLLGADTETHRAALGLSEQILLAATPDLVGLWHARTALGTLRNQLRLDPDRVALILNQYDRRYHHGRTQIEWALDMPVAAVVPYDHGAAQRSLIAQVPLVVHSRGGRASRALLELAGRVHGGTITLPPEPSKNGRRPWRHWPATLRPPWAGPARRRVEKGAPGDNHVVPVG